MLEEYVMIPDLQTKLTTHLSLLLTIAYPLDWWRDYKM